MNTLSVLFEFFLRQLLQIAGIFTFGSIIGILALDKLFGGYDFYLGMLVFVAPLIAWSVTFKFVPKNLDWLMSLPISKKQIMLLNYISSIASSLVIGISGVVVIVVLSLFQINRTLSLDMLAKVGSSAAVHAELKAQLSTHGSETDIYTIMTVLLLVSLFHGLSMAVSRPSTAGRYYLNLLNDSNWIVRWGMRTAWIPVLALAAAFRQYLLAPFGIFMLGIGAFILFPAYNTTRALALSKLERQRWLAVSLALVFVEIAVLYSHAIKGTHSNKAELRVASVMFLGPYTKNASQADIAQLLEAELDSERTTELASYYRDKFNRSQKVRIEKDQKISFQKTVASKKSFKSIIAALGLFDLSSLGIHEVEAYLKALDPYLHECHCDYRGYELLQANLTTNDVLKLLESNSDTAAAFAILWSRYHFDQESDRVRRALAIKFESLKDRSKIDALLTFSVAAEKILSLNDWHKNRIGRAISSVAQPSIQCPSVVAQANEGLLNKCIRAKIDLSKASEIEAIGWFKFPLDTRSSALAKKAGLRIPQSLLH